MGPGLRLRTVLAPGRGALRPLRALLRGFAPQRRAVGPGGPRVPSYHAEPPRSWYQRAGHHPKVAGVGYLRADASTRPYKADASTRPYKADASTRTSHRRGYLDTLTFDIHRIVSTRNVLPSPSRLWKLAVRAILTLLAP